MIRGTSGSVWLGILLAICLAGRATQAGLIKDIYKKVTNTNNQTEDKVKQSAPICGSSVFSTPNEASLSPELILISTRPSRVESVRSNNGRDKYQGGASGGGGGGGSGRDQSVEEISREFRFHAENVTIEELERHGFNPDAPVSFLMHGFTSGYPLQAWISAIVEAYTIDRETGDTSHTSSLGGADDHERGPQGHRDSSWRERDENEGRRRNSNADSEDEAGLRRDKQRDRSRSPTRAQSGGRAKAADHNLFVVNWNYAARGIVYPRAVANIPIVASYVTRFINERLIDEARVDPKRIQLIGHSLGAHLAGFVGKNTKTKVGRIYGLDPAGPCFGAVAGPLYPSSKRLAPGDADEVITIQTNSALLGIEKPLGRYSVFVEGGANQPGCKPSGVLKSIGTLTWDGGDFDTVACSHSRAPNLLTYRRDQSDSQDDCQLVAYACKDWQSFLDGHCGVCQPGARQRQGRASSPLDPVDCRLIGLDWQYPSANKQSGARPKPSRRPASTSSFSEQDEHYENQPSGGQADYHSPSRRPTTGDQYGQSWRENSQAGDGRRKPQSSSSSSVPFDRQRRGVDERELSNSSVGADERRSRDRDEVESISMFMKTGDTQPYCTFHYQLVLELNESFGRKKPPMSIILQDSEPDARRGPATSGPAPSRRRGREQNSLSSDEFGNKFDEKTYTHLLTSNKKLARIDHATMIFREGLRDGHRVLKALHVNYMSHQDPRVRERLSTRLCPVRSQDDRSALNSGDGVNRIYFKPCDRQREQPTGDSSPTSGSDYGASSTNNDGPSYSSAQHHGSGSGFSSGGQHGSYGQDRD